LASDDDRLLRDALLERARKALESAQEGVEEADVLAHLSASLAEERLLSRCAWCGRYRAGEQWIVIADSAAPLQRAGSTHGICPDCLTDLRRSGKSV